MALLDSAHRLSTARHPRARARGGIHPSICLVSGFVFTVAAALVVHLAFNAVF